MQALLDAVAPHAALRLHIIGAAEPCRRQPRLRRSWSIGCMMMRSTDCKAPPAPFELEKTNKILLAEDKPAARNMLGIMTGSIRSALQSIGDGKISVSPYDTAWVALVKNIDGENSPQFPSSIDWIVRNQLADGSWGEERYFLLSDRIINTLACVIALQSWNMHHDRCRTGVSFINENVRRLRAEDQDWMPVGFEIAFPALLEMAKNLNLDVHLDEPTLQMIYLKRDQKLSKIPKDFLHAEMTTLLYSLEGMRNLDWERLLKLRCPDGSFLQSPASTAYAFMQTGDKKCFQFLDEIVHKFNGGAPILYPVDIFDRLWVVDRLERLGISRYFTSEIAECLDYAYRHWSPKGISFARDWPVKDVDDTAMGFRLLRLHGYLVSPCAFKHFETDGGEFMCYPRETNQSVTSIYNLYRAAQVAFPGEDELRRANSYSRAFLEERRASGKLCDKWLIAKDLPGEVAYALDFPWRASLPRIETRLYLEQYGGSGDVWIGKVLYRMPFISNDFLLDAAKADFSDFQRRCRLEWHGVKKWLDRSGLQQVFGVVTAERALRAYFLAAANLFEPDRAVERLAWARTSVLAEAVSCYLQCNDGCSDSKKESLILKLDNHGRNELTRWQEDRRENTLLCALGEVINLARDDEDASDDLREAWKRWINSWTSEEESHEPCQGSAALLLVRTLEICSGRHRLTGKNLNLSEYCHLERLTYSICSKLVLASRVVDWSGANMESNENSDKEVELEMQELTKCVLQSCTSINKVTRLAFLSVVKSFYYVAHSSVETIDGHISQVLFEDVI